MSDDINEIARSLMPKQPTPAGPSWIDRKLGITGRRLNREHKNEMKTNEGPIIELCQQFQRWASKNNIPTNWRCGAARGWKLSTRTTYYGTDNAWPSGAILVVTTTGHVGISSGESYFRRVLGETRANPERVGWWSTEEVRAGIAQYVADSGIPW